MWGPKAAPPESPLSDSSWGSRIRGSFPLRSVVVVLHARRTRTLPYSVPAWEVREGLGPVALLVRMLPTPESSTVVLIFHRFVLSVLGRLISRPRGELHERWFANKTRVSGPVRLSCPPNASLFSEMVATSRLYVSPLRGRRVAEEKSRMVSASAGDGFFSRHPSMGEGARHARTGQGLDAAATISKVWNRSAGLGVFSCFVMN